ncbi:hypothetical protein KR044_003593 [Drosophila immigrans]|nr:hypothetical protein KR044_003593 [Drosophila immigrans]
MGRLFLLQEHCLRLMGHSMDSRSDDDDSILTLRLKYFGSLLLVVSAEYPMLSYVMHNRDDVELVTASLSVVFTNLLTVIKISTFLVYKQNFWQLMQSFRQIYPQSHQSAEVVGSAYITADNKLAALLGRAYCISCACTGLYFMLDPIVKIISSHWHGELYIRELPMPMKFPFNDVNTPGYEFGFVYTVFVTIAVVLYASAVDGLFISFAFNLRAHFLALQQRIQQLTFDLPDEATQQQQMVQVVQYHVKLLNLAKQLRITYMPIVFAQFLITSIQVGVIIYQILTVGKHIYIHLERFSELLLQHMNNVMALLRFFSFFGSIMLQLFLYCYGGELIKNEAGLKFKCNYLQVGVAVQLSDWHLATPKQRRSLAFVMHRSQRGMLIKAGFYEASLANFLAVI